MEKQIQAINKFFYWSMNYDGSLEWMQEIWQGCMLQHMKEKFARAYKSAGAIGVINRFYGELDGENRRKLLTWVMNNYHDDPKL